MGWVLRKWKVMLGWKVLVYSNKDCSVYEISAFVEKERVCEQRGQEMLPTDVVL